jgi:uncharacterized membrane protein
MNDFFTLSYIGTFAGMVVAVNLLTQATKTFFDFATRWLVLAYALILQVCIIIITGRFDLTSIILGIINAVLVAMTAIGAYQIKEDKGMSSVK